MAEEVQEDDYLCDNGGSHRRKGFEFEFAKYQNGLWRFLFFLYNVEGKHCRGKITSATARTSAAVNSN